MTKPKPATPKKTPIKTKFLVALTPQQLELMRQESKEKGIAVADIIRRAIDDRYESK